MLSTTRFRTGDQTLVREINLSLILNQLREYTSLSRAALADQTGLNKSTVSSLVQELLDRQFVREAGLSSAGTGRPSTLLELNPEAGYIVSCEIGVDFISLIATNFAAQVVWRHHESTHNSTQWQPIVEHVVTLLQRAIDMRPDVCPRCGHVLGIAVGVPGLVDRTNGEVLFAPNLGWQNVPLLAVLQKAFPEVTVFVDNEANMAALGEYFFGAAQGYGEVLFISLGVGLGGAVIYNGQLFKGQTGFASEFGHMTMDPGGELCNCGNRGCWETQVGQLALFRHIAQLIRAGEPSALNGILSSHPDRMAVSLVIEAAHAGDHVALKALDQIAHYLGIGIASLVNIFNPDLVMLGGALSLAGDFLLPTINQELQQRALRWNLNATRVALAKQGFDACMMGGVAVVYQTILAQPSNVAQLPILGEM